MLLLSLPSEMMQNIFDEIGSEFFRLDLRRLTISKQWFEYAQPAYYNTITLNPTTSSNLSAYPVAPIISAIEKSLQSLYLFLDSPNHWSDSNKITSWYEYAEDSNVVGGGVQPAKDHNEPQALHYTERLDKNLTWLTILLRNTPRLRQLHVRALGIYNSGIYESFMPCLTIPTMQEFFLGKSLSVLVLDIPGMPFETSHQEGEAPHLCPAIGNLLHTLRVLHLRMRNICSDTLKPQDTSRRVSLKTVIINLSLADKLSKATAASHSIQCGRGHGGLPQLKAAIRGQAEALIPRMASPTVVRILNHTLPHFKFQSLDVTNGQIMILDEGMMWDQDGLIVEDSGSESEFLDSDEFSSFEDE